MLRTTDSSAKVTRFATYDKNQVPHPSASRNRSIAILPNGRSLLWELNYIRYSHGLFEGYLLHATFKIGEAATVTHEMVRTGHADHSMGELEWHAPFQQA
jgi:hypothetical protein